MYEYTYQLRRKIGFPDNKSRDMVKFVYQFVKLCVFNNVCTMQ